MTNSMSCAPDARPDLIEHARRIGARDRYAGRQILDLADADSAVLMDEVGETGPTTEANADLRALICDAYEDEWHDAHAALGPAA